MRLLAPVFFVGVMSRDRFGPNQLTPSCVGLIALEPQRDSSTKYYAVRVLNHTLLRSDITYVPCTLKDITHNSSCFLPSADHLSRVGRSSRCLFRVGRYEGWFKEDKRHGEGTLILAGGGKYVSRVMGRCPSRLWLVGCLNIKALQN